MADKKRKRRRGETEITIYSDKIEGDASNFYSCVRFDNTVTWFTLFLCRLIQKRSRWRFR